MKVGSGFSSSCPQHLFVPHHDEVERPQLWIQSHYSAFNGLRALAILSVFFCHYGPILAPAHFHRGLLWAGVDIFFVLSGFLITGIVYENRTSDTYYRDFYLRRALRILPLTYGTLLVVGAIAYFAKLGSPRVLLPDLIFIQNFMFRSIGLRAVSFGPTGFHTPYGSIGLGMLWSLCVEEQFYLFWPVVVRCFPSRTKLLGICFTGAVGVITLRCILLCVDTRAAQITGYLYAQTYTRLDTLLIGAALNLWLQQRTLTRTMLHKISRGVFLGSCALLAAALVLFGRGEPINELNPAIQSIGFTLIAGAAAAVLLRSLDPTSRMSSLLGLPWLKRIGQVSFGFYIFHDIPTRCFAGLADRLPHACRPVIVGAAFGIIYMMSIISYRFLEAPILRLKDRLAPRPDANQIMPFVKRTLTVRQGTTSERSKIVTA